MATNRPLQAAPSPNDKTLVNLVDTISPERQKKIAEEIITQYDLDIQSRAEWAESRDKWYKLWACIRKPKSTPWVGASNVCIPIMATACNQFSARSYQSIFAAPGMVKTVPVSQNDFKRAKNVEDFLNWQTLYDMEEYEEVFDTILSNLPINGTAFKKLYYDRTKKKNVSEYIGALDLVLPYRTKSMETARRLTHRLWLHYEELEDRNDAGLYSNFDKIQPTASKSNIEALPDTVDDTTGEQPVSSTEHPHLILECHKKYKLKEGDDRQPYVFTVDRDSHTLLRVTSRLFKRGKEEIELNYFTDYHFIPNPEGFYSFGFGHFLEPLNEMANTAFNQIFDAGRLSNQPFGFYGRKSGLRSKKIGLHPGKMVEVDDAKQVYFPSMQRVDNVLFQVLGLVQQYTEQFTSTSEYLTGRESKGTKTPTASGTLAIIEQGLVTFAVMTKRIFRSLRKELRLLMLLNQMFLDDKLEYRVMGAEEDIAFRDIKKEDFIGVHDVIPIGDPTYASRQMRRAEAQEVYSLMMQNPLVIGSPPDAEGNQAIPPNPAAMWELSHNLLETYNVGNKNKILPPLPEDIVSPEIENAMFMQGDYKGPEPGEDHETHISAHLAFRGSEFFLSMPSDYQNLLERHVIETQQIAFLDQQQQSMLGGEVKGTAGGAGVAGPQEVVGG